MWIDPNTDLIPHPQYGGHPGWDHQFNRLETDAGINPMRPMGVAIHCYRSSTTLLVNNPYCLAREVIKY